MEKEVKKTTPKLASLNFVSLLLTARRGKGDLDLLKQVIK